MSKNGRVSGWSVLAGYTETFFFGPLLLWLAILALGLSTYRPIVDFVFDVPEYQVNWILRVASGITMLAVLWGTFLAGVRAGRFGRQEKMWGPSAKDRAMFKAAMGPYGQFVPFAKSVGVWDATNREVKLAKMYGYRPSVVGLALASLLLKEAQEEDGQKLYESVARQLQSWRWWLRRGKILRVVFNRHDKVGLRLAKFVGYTL